MTWQARLMFIVVVILYAIAGTALAAKETLTIAIVTPTGKRDNSAEVGFRKGLEVAGFTPNYVTFTFSGQPNEREQLRQQLRTLKPALIYTWGTASTIAVAGTPFSDPADNEGIQDIPIVFVGVGAPDGVGLVKSLPWSERNLTGVPHIPPTEAQVDAMGKYLPWRWRRIGCVYNPAEPNSVVHFRKLVEDLKHLDIELIMMPVQRSDDEAALKASIVSSVQEIAKRKVDWLYLGPDLLTSIQNPDTVTNAAIELGLPTFSVIETPVRSSNAMYGLFVPRLLGGRMTAEVAVAILRGQKTPQMIPMKPRRPSILGLNARTAKILHLPPPPLLARSMQVFNVESEGVTSVR